MTGCFCCSANKALAATAIIAGGVSCSKVNDLDKRLTQLEQTVSDLKA